MHRGGRGSARKVLVGVCGGCLYKGFLTSAVSNVRPLNRAQRMMLCAEAPSTQRGRLQREVP